MKKAKLAIKQSLSRRRSKGGTSQNELLLGDSLTPNTRLQGRPIWPTETYPSNGQPERTDSMPDTSDASTSPTRESITSSPSSVVPAWMHDPDLDDIWNTLFGNYSHYPTSHSLTPQPTAGPSTIIPGQQYLHHYVNAVMPLQYRFTGSLSVGSLVVPLAMSRKEVLTSVTALAALHLSVRRSKCPEPPTLVSTSSALQDVALAISTHQDSIQRLRCMSSSDCIAENIVVCAMFAVSYHTFMGGTSKGWQEVLAISQRCLSTALASSPELFGFPAK